MHNEFTIQLHNERPFGRLKPAGSSSAPPSALWAPLWKTKIPPKIKIFLWRACRNYIPTRGNLAKRHIPIDPRCRFCGFEIETTVHSLIFCPFVEDAWTNSPFETLRDQRQDQNLWETIMHATKPPTLDNLGLLAIMAWEIWSCRNKFIHEERKPDMAAIFSKAVSLSDDYALFNLSPQQHQALSGLTTWSPPATKRWKLNTDASLTPDSDFGGIGGCIRDADGGVCLAFCSHIHNTSSVLAAELIAIREGIIVATRCGFTSCEIETDSLTAVKLLRDGGKNVKEEGLIAEDIISISLQCNFSFHFIRRTGNCVADRLAELGSKSPVPSLWLNTTPPCIMDLLKADLALVP